MVSVARCLSSTMASKDISSCIIGWFLTKLDRDDPYMVFINLILNGFIPFYTCIYLKWAKIDFRTEKNNNKIHKALSLDAYYEALPSRRLPSLFQLWHCGQKWLCSGFTIFTLANYRANIKHIFLSESTRSRALICLCLFVCCVHLSIISTEVYLYIP